MLGLHDCRLENTQNIQNNEIHCKCELVIYTVGLSPANDCCLENTCTCISQQNNESHCKC